MDLLYSHFIVMIARFERAKQALEGAVSISEKGEVAARLPLVITKF